jgi:hypothetical protein
MEGFQEQQEFFKLPTESIIKLSKAQSLPIMGQSGSSSADPGMDVDVDLYYTMNL